MRTPACELLGMEQPIAELTAGSTHHRPGRRPGLPLPRPAGTEAAQPRRERFTADRTARIEALAVFVSMPTPQKTWPPISHST